MMKRILFDLKVAQPNGNSKYHGGGEYTKTVFKYFVENYSNIVKIDVFYSFDEFIDDWIKELISKYNINEFNVSNYENLGEIVDFDNYKVLFVGITNEFYKCKNYENIRVISVYHGLRTLELPRDKTVFLYSDDFKTFIKNIFYYYFHSLYSKRKYRIEAKRLFACNDVIGDSNYAYYSARTLIKDFDNLNSHVFYAPEKNRIICDTNIFKHHEKKIILMMGGNRWEKNTYRGIMAIDSLLSDGFLNGYIVKVVGGIPTKIYKRIKNKTHFVSLDYLSAEDLEENYASCDLFFYPTINEGFGYPPLEAMEYNKTCVVSAVTSLTEIYGESVYYVNPFDIKEMKTRIIQACEKKIDNELILLQKERIKSKQRSDLKDLCELIIN